MTINNKLHAIARIIKKKPIVTMAAVATAAQLLSTTAYAATATTVQVKIDDEVKVVSTHASTVNELLQELNIKVDEADFISAQKETELTENMTVEWRPAVRIIVTIDGEKLEKWTNLADVKTFLEEEHIDIGENDSVTPSLDELINENTEINIKTAIPVKVIDGGVEKEEITTARTVADLLAEKEIVLNEFDRVETNVGDKLVDSDVVSIVRTAKDIVTVDETIERTVETKDDPTLFVGEKKVITEGQDGIRRQTIEKISENGTVVAENLISEEMVQEPVNKVVAVGTKAPVVTPKAPAQPAKSFTESAVPANASVSAMLEYAKTFLGIPYRTGGSLPSTGFDCSGYVSYVFKNVYGMSLPRSSAGMFGVGTTVSTPQPGDLVFFRTGSRISHVGISLGGSSFISSTSSVGIKIDSLSGGYWGPKYAGAKRM